jgi:prefoldin alpha subunit
MAKDDQDKAKQQSLQQKYIAYQVAEQQIKAHQQQLEKFEQQLNEIMTVVEALDDISKAKKDTEVLVPLSGGIFFRTRMDENQKFLVNVGSGTVVEKSVEETKKLVEEQAKEIEKYKTQVSNNLIHLITEYQMLEAELRKMSE